MSELSESSPRYTSGAQRSGPIPISAKLFQGLGALPGAHKDFAFNTFLLLFYTQVLGLSATWAAAALAFGLVIDALTDPMMGAYSDTFRSARFESLGRRHFFMYLSAVPVGVFLFLLFSPPAGLSKVMLFGWLLSFVVLTRLSFTLFVVPWSALPAELTDSYSERTSLFVFRFLVGWAGGLLFVALCYGVLFVSAGDTPGQLIEANYSRFAIVLGVLVTLWIALTTHLTRNQVPFLRQPVTGRTSVSVPALVGQLQIALQSKNLRLLFLSTLAFSGIAGTGQVFDSYMNTYFWEFAPEQLLGFTLSGVGALAAFVSVGPLQQRYEKQHILRFAIAVVMFLGMLKVTLRFAGVLPANHDPMLLYILIAHLALVIYVVTIAGILFGSILADTVDEQSARVGQRQEGVFASAISFSAKAAPSLGIVLGGVLLAEVIGLDDSRLPGDVAEPVLFRLAFIDGILINALFVFPLVWLRNYSLTREDISRLQNAQ